MFIFVEVEDSRGQANKSSNILISGIQNPGNKATVLGQTDEYSKKPTLFPSFVLELGDTHEKMMPSSIPAAPHPYNGKKDRLCPTQEIFRLNQRDTSGIKLDILSPSPKVELGNSVRFLKMHPSDQEQWPSFRDSESRKSK